jgi:hypothetical protein
MSLTVAPAANGVGEVMAQLFHPVRSPVPTGLRVPPLSAVR